MKIWNLCDSDTSLLKIFKGRITSVYYIVLQVYAEKYAEDQEAFFKDYAEAHAKLSNGGAKFDPPEVDSYSHYWKTNKCSGGY